MNHQSNKHRAEIAAILCNALDAAGLSWSIVHGSEGYPERVGRDLDILLSRKWHEQATKIVHAVAEEQGWKSCLIPLSWAGAPVYLWKLHGNNLLSFEMHFIDRIDWAGCILATGDDACSEPLRLNGLPISIWPGFAKRVLTQILAGCWERITERPDDFKIKAYESAVLLIPMKRLFGEEAGPQLLDLIRRNDIDKIRQLSFHYRFQLLKRAMNPLTNVKLSLRWLYGKIARTLGLADWRPPILIISKYNARDHSGSDLVAEVSSHLGFGQTIFLNSNFPNSIIGRMRLKWNIHVQRGLFRLVAIQNNKSDRSLSDITDFFGKLFQNHNAFIVNVDETNKSDCSWSYQDMDGNASGMNSSYEMLTSEIAYQYMECMKRLASRY